MEQLYFIEMTHPNGTFQPYWIVLHRSGTRGVSPRKEHATTMRLGEAWAVLQEVRRTPADSFAYNIVEA